MCATQAWRVCCVVPEGGMWIIDVVGKFDNVKGFWGYFISIISFKRVLNFLNPPGRVNKRELR